MEYEYTAGQWLDVVVLRWNYDHSSEDSKCVLQRKLFVLYRIIFPDAYVESLCLTCKQVRTKLNVRSLIVVSKYCLNLRSWRYRPASASTNVTSVKIIGIFLPVEQLSNSRAHLPKYVLLYSTIVDCPGGNKPNWIFPTQCRFHQDPSA